MPETMNDSQPEHISGYYPDVWAAAQWMLDHLTADAVNWRRYSDEPGSDAAQRINEAHQAIIRHYVDLDATHNHYAGPERLEALVPIIEALTHIYSNQPGWNPHWNFE